MQNLNFPLSYFDAEIINVQWFSVFVFRYKDQVLVEIVIQNLVKATPERL